MYPPTPPLTPATPATSTKPIISISTNRTMLREINQSTSPELLTLPPPLHTIPELDLDGSISLDEDSKHSEGCGLEEDKGAWREGMSAQEKIERSKWLGEKRGRKGLRIVIVTGNSGGGIYSSLV
jgi:hypothetical protein